MKIAMIGHKQVPSRSGGIEVAVEALAVRMADRGHDVTLYNRGRHPHVHNQIYKGMRIRSVPVLPIQGIAAVMGSVFATVRALFGSYDCIHFHAEGIAAMSFLPRLFGIHTVVTIHGLDWKRSKWGNFASWYLKLGEKVAAACANEIIVLSQSTKQYFLDTYGRETVYIPNGMPPAVHRSASLIREKWGLEKDQYFLYLGRIVPEKGLEALIRSFFQVQTDKKLVIAGSPDDLPEHYAHLREIAANDERILFTGFAKGQILEELYSNCYVYCLPSRLEGMPISLLEALSFGNCCLSSNIPECTEVLGDFGFHFPSGSIAGLRTVLQMLCDFPELVEDRRNMVRGNFTHYTWDEVVDETLALYQFPEEKRET